MHPPPLKLLQELDMVVVASDLGQKYYKQISSSHLNTVFIGTRFIAVIDILICTLLRRILLCI